MLRTKVCLGTKRSDHFGNRTGLAPPDDEMPLLRRARQGRTSVYLCLLCGLCVSPAGKKWMPAAAGTKDAERAKDNKGEYTPTVLKFIGRAPA